MNFLSKLNKYKEKEWIPEKIGSILESFYLSYRDSLISHGISIISLENCFIQFLEFVRVQILHPFIFQPYHQQILTPFDYYQFGVDFLRPLVDLKHSSVNNLTQLDEIEKHIHSQHNVILLANHQTEADPQAISVLLENTHPKLAKELIFIAGERVITDPLAIPFSMGRNLLCIYSKRYIDQPPEEKTRKQLHNKRTMELMRQLLSEGGKSIYVAPSGGRDRRNAKGIVEVAPFDPQSIEMLYLMAQKATKPTFFYPFTLATYSLLPPPETIQKELGELRLTKRGAIHLSFGQQIVMESFPGSEQTDKHERRRLRAEYIWNLVCQDYSKFSA